MRSTRKRVLAYILILTMVLAWNNGYGITIVNASENADYEAYVISKEQYENFISTKTIEPEGDSCSGSLSSILSSLSNEAYTYISRKAASSTNSEQISIPANAHVIIDCQLNQGTISSINLGENAECVLEGTYNSDLQYNGSTGSLLTIESAVINGVISGNNHGSLNLIESGKIYGLNNIENFIVNPNAELLVQPMSNGVYKPVSFNSITGTGTLNLIYNGYPKYENESSVEVTEVPDFLGTIDLGNNSNGRSGYVNLRFITHESIDEGEYRTDVELPTGTQAIHIAEDLAVPLLTNHKIKYGYSLSLLTMDLNGSLSDRTKYKLIISGVSDLYDFKQGSKDIGDFGTCYPDLLMQGLSKLKAGYYNIAVTTEENISFGNINLPENIQGLYITGNLSKRNTARKPISIDSITMASGGKLILDGIRETSTDNIDVNIVGSEVNKTAEVTLVSSRIAGIISCQSGVDIRIEKDDVVKGIEGATNLTLNGDLDVAEKLSVSNQFKLNSTYNLVLESGATVNLNNVKANDIVITDKDQENYAPKSYSLNMLYECRDRAYPNVTIAGSTNFGETSGIYWYDSTPTDDRDYKDNWSYIYYRDVMNNGQTERQRYVNLNEKWHVLDNETVTACENGFDSSNLLVETINEGIHITAYNSYTASDDAIYEDSYNINDALLHKADSSSCPIEQVLTADYTALFDVYKSFRIDFSNESWKYDFSTYHGDTKFISQVDESNISIGTYADSYNEKKAGFIHAIHSKPFMVYILEKKDFEDFEQGKDYTFSTNQILKVGSLAQLASTLYTEPYVVIKQVLDNSLAEDITIPEGCHCILSTDTDVTGKLGNVTVQKNATLGIQGNFTGNIQCIGSDNYTDTTEDDSQFVLRDFNLKGIITGNHKGKLTFIHNNTLSGITNFDNCNLVNSDNLDVVPDQNGKYDRVSFKELHGTADFHISYCGYPSNQDGDTEQILVPELTPNIMLGEKTVKTAANDTYTVWYEGDNRYISDGDVYYSISYDPDHAGCIVKGEPASDITSEDVHCKGNNLSVTYYNSSDFANRVVQEVPTDGPYVNFGSLKNGFEMIYSNKVVCSDYPNCFIDCDGRLHSKNTGFISVKELTKENFDKVGTGAFDAISDIPTCTADNAMTITSYLKSPYVVFTVNSDNQSFKDLEVPESKIGLAIQSGEKEAKHFAYKLDSIKLYNNQTLVLDNLRTDNTKTLSISMAQEGTSGTVRFINARVNQEIRGTNDITVEVKGNNAFKSLSSCKELLVDGPQLTIEKTLDGIGAIKIATNSSLIAKSTASIRLPKIICDSYLSQTGNNDVQHYYALNILAEQVETQLPDILFSDMIEPRLSDQYVLIMPYLYENSIDGGNMYAEQNYNWGEFEKNQLSLTSNEAYIFKVDKEIMLKENPNDLLGKILLCYKDASLHFDAVDRECMRKEGNDLSFVGYTKDATTNQIELSKKFGYCNADFKDLWNTFTIGALANQNYSGRENVPEVTLSSNVSDYQLRKGVDYDIEYSNNVNAVQGTVTVKGKWLFDTCQEKIAHFNTNPRNIGSSGIEVQTIVDQVYSGGAIKPSINITDTGCFNAKLVEGTDYILEYTDNITVGRATVQIKGRNNYSGTITRTFNIIQKNLNSDTIKVADIVGQVYTGSGLEPALTITDSAREDAVLVVGTDYIVKYDNNVATGTDTATNPPKVTITGIGNYTGTITKAFSIASKSIDSDTIKVADIIDQVYTGSGLEPALTITDSAREDAVLVAGTDYIVKYDHNVATGTDTATNPPKVTITGIGNYTGTITKTFIIVSKRIDSDTIKVADIVGQVYTGSVLEPALTITDSAREDAVLEAGIDYTVKYDHNVATGTDTATNPPKVTITGIGNYTGTITKTFIIVSKRIDSDTIKVADIVGQVYTGSVLEPALTITDSAREDAVLVAGIDYTVKYDHNVATGTDTATNSPKVTITGIGNYTGTITKTFNIVSKRIDSDTIKVADIIDQVYTGSGLEPALTITDSAREDAVLVVGTDYTVKYDHNVATGTDTATNPPKVTITGIGNYTGTITKTFNIGSKSIDSDTIKVADIVGQVYTGSVLKPALTITDSAREDAVLVAGVDYTVKYDHNIVVGIDTATNSPKVTITGIGNYTGIISKSFSIAKRSISSAVIATIVSQTYSGSYIKPAPKVTLKINGTTVTLKYGIDYTLDYTKNINTGTATVIITGKGNYTGTIVRSFKIVSKQISPKISTISSKYYTGKAQKPSVTVKYGTKTLKNNSDYTLSYKNNTNVGTATVTIAGKGNYSFSKKITFKIMLKKGATYTVGNFKYQVTSTSGSVTLVKSTNTKATSITVGSIVKIGSKTCNITAIGDKAMSNHKKLTKVTIGSNVTSIGDKVFSSCGKIKSIVISSSKLKKVGKQAFSGIYSKAKIKVPKAKLKAYQKLLKSKGQKSTVKITV